MDAEDPHIVDSPRVLVVDDEAVIREILSDFLTMEGYVVRTVQDGAVAIEELLVRPYDVVISDLKMPKMGGLELLQRIQEEKLDVLTIIMTGFGTVETATEAMKKGAYDYILKPFKVEDVIHTVERGLSHRRLAAENVRLREAISLYRVSEAMATSLEIEHILDVIVDATITEMHADVVTLHLTDERTQLFEERVRRLDAKGDVKESDGLGTLNLDELTQYYRDGRPILAHGIKAGRFFSVLAEERKLVSFASVPLKVRDRVIGMLNAYSFTRSKKFDEGQRKMLAILGGRAATSIENARLYENLVGKNEDLRRANLSLRDNFRQTIVGFAYALEESDPYTRGHSERVSLYARLTAEGLTLGADEVERVVQAGLLHDIGKIGIRYDKLNKPGKLTPEEVAMFRMHPEKGKRILEPIPFMRELVPATWCHHEAYDGTGYPRELERDSIPLLGRIIAVADTYDAMTSDRPYRKALPHYIAVAEIERCSGSQFDPDVTAVFLEKIERHRSHERAAGRRVGR